MSKRARAVLAASVLIAAFVNLNNSALFARTEPGPPVLLAHRGLAQTFSREGLGRDDCTATRIFPPEHSYLENTLASMQAAFRSGANIVEIDVHPTTDGRFAVFHDWTVDCRTEGKGVTREHTLAELKALDIGYGYTADGGKTFPFRGKGVGLMPSLDEVLAAFPDNRFLINIKSNDPAEGETLATRLEHLNAMQRSNLMVYGGDRPIAALHARLPEIPVGSHATMKSCIVRYFALGWTGYVPESCRQGIMLVPLNVAPWLWGWPHRYLQRMLDAKVHAFIAGPYTGQATGGIDDVAQLSQLPKDFSGGIWTDRIDRIGAALHRSR